MSTLKVNRIEPRTGDTVEIVGFEPGTAGKILQVVQGTYDTMATTTSATYVESGLQASITPSSTSNKILVIAHVAGFRGIPSGAGDSSGGEIALYRGGASIIDKCSQNFSSNGGITTDAVINYIDSPNSTSSLNYEIYFRAANNNTQRCQDSDLLSSIILMEVSG